jgi:hypothetical protein
MESPASQNIRPNHFWPKMFTASCAVQNPAKNDSFPASEEAETGAEACNAFWRLLTFGLVSLTRSSFGILQFLTASYSRASA